MRVRKLESMDKKPQAQELYDAIMKTFFFDAQARMQKNATDALVSFIEGDLLKTFLMGVKRFTKYPPTNVKNHRRAIAKTLIEQNEYCF